MHERDEKECIRYFIGRDATFMHREHGLVRIISTVRLESALDSTTGEKILNAVNQFELHPAGETQFGSSNTLGRLEGLEVKIKWNNPADISMTGRMSELMSMLTTHDYYVPTFVCVEVE